jgi:membrane protein DedA with SNARE-associated domain
MNHLLSLAAHHGYLLIFAVILAESLGLPAPAALALIAGGAAASAKTLSAPGVLLLALAAMMTGDSLLFVLGRQMGWALLGFLCRVSANPESCILTSAESFYKRGKATLVVAKFIPGLNSMAPPLAGSMKMRLAQFWQLDLAGAALYVGAYFGLGYVFRDFLGVITRGFQETSRVLTELLLVAALAYVVYKIWNFRRNKDYRVVPRVQVEELARRLKSEEKDKILVVDVRSHGYYDSGAQRIEGSIRLEPNHLSEELASLAHDKDIYLYCT